MKERRNGVIADTGKRRRDTDLREREEEWRLLRDKILIGVGIAGLALMGLASVSVGIKDSAVALAVTTAFGGLLGLPQFLRWDERRRDR